MPVAAVCESAPRMRREHLGRPGVFWCVALGCDEYAARHAVAEHERHGVVLAFAKSLGQSRI
ncbi:hypothetical protein THIARS_50222 [Thiomonas delicata]|uniref:Uncharacterized protein n=1 Tax=Thiomonas delicata TaxID=364030 RepID=A0A238D194_THIDL|nr:hypothetical protein THIARS_50222 [Thiomonas delicata]